MYTQPIASTGHIPQDPNIPPYNPQDYIPQPTDQYGYPPRAGDNVSRDIPLPTFPAATRDGNREVPYFPPPPTVPVVPHDEGALLFLLPLFHLWHTISISTRLLTAP